MSPNLQKGQGELILVVDDEESVLRIVEKALETFGYKVITANNGLEAVDLYAEHKKEIKVTIIDIMMPLLDGWATIQKLKEIEPQAIIIATSGVVENEDYEKLDEVGAKTFLVKPYNIQTLLATLGRILQSKSS